MALYDRERIEARMTELLDAIDDYIELAKSDNRELKPEESEAIKAHRAELEDLETDLVEAKKLEDIRARREERRQVVNPLPTPEIDNPSPTQAAVIPAQVARTRFKNWKVFPGQSRHEAATDAYRSGRFLAAVLFGHDNSREWCGQHSVPIRSAMSGGDGLKGGHLVPDEFETMVIDLREQYGVARRYADVVSMGGDHRNVPKRTGNLTAYAVSDNDTITASDMNWKNVELTAKKWAVLARYSSELNEDSFINLADELSGNAAWALAKKEDESVFIGDGTSTYHGTVGITVRANDGSHTGALYTALTANTAFSTLDLVDFEGIMGALPLYAEEGAAWFFHKVGYSASIARLQDAAGGNTKDDLGDGPVRQFLGYPVALTQVLNSTVGAQVSTVVGVFGNLRQGVTIGDRRGLTVAVDGSRYFDQDQLAIRITTRTAINVHTLASPDSSSSRGPIICLKTPTS